MGRILLSALLCSAVSFSNPYPDENAVPKDALYRPSHTEIPTVTVDSLGGADILRVDVSWSSDEEYKMTQAILEKSGTPGLFARSKQPNKLGSYQGLLLNVANGDVIAQDSLGTGQAYRMLVRGMTFRFPPITQEVEFKMLAENPQTGIMEQVLSERISPNVPRGKTPSIPLEVKVLKEATVEPALNVVFYAEGYQESGATKFGTSATRAMEALQKANWPEFNRMRFVTVFSPSAKAIGTATNLGMPVAERDSFLGLYYPYWFNFGRWYHVVYPTREERFRDRIGMVPYDHPIVIVDNNEYWGVGNYNELTAIPAGNSSFTYLLLHEYGHYFGLNEEYEGGGPTELAFAPEINEPWSQNITFLSSHAPVKWGWAVANSTPVPTPKSLWNSAANGPIGAYLGGYADTEPQGQSHKPGHNCVMKNGPALCKVCERAVADKVKFDAGAP